MSDAMHRAKSAFSLAVIPDHSVPGVPVPASANIRYSLPPGGFLRRIWCQRPRKLPGPRALDAFGIGTLGDRDPLWTGGLEGRVLLGEIAEVQRGDFPLHFGAHSVCAHCTRCDHIGTHHPSHCIGGAGQFMRLPIDAILVRQPFEQILTASGGKLGLETPGTTSSFFAVYAGSRVGAPAVPVVEALCIPLHPNRPAHRPDRG